MQWQFEAIGTHWTIDIDPGGPNCSLLEQKIRKLIEEYDLVYSRFRTDSLIHRISLKAGRFKFPDSGQEIMALYRQLYQLTSGSFTPLIGDTLIGAGYDQNYTLTPTHLDSPPNWEEVLNYRHPFLETTRPVTLDFGAAGKGQLIKLVAQALTDQHVYDFTIDAGGDIAYHASDGQKLRVGLEDPSDPTKVIGVIELESGQAIASSAGNRRRWSQYHHIIDPHKLASPKEILACWVIAKQPMVADGLATSMFLVNPTKLLTEFEFEYLILYPDMQVYRSGGFKAELFDK